MVDHTWATSTIRIANIHMGNGKSPEGASQGPSATNSNAKTAGPPKTKKSKRGENNQLAEFKVQLPLRAHEPHAHHEKRLLQKGATQKDQSAQNEAVHGYFSP